ncbi:MAG: suppressor of loss of ypt1 [Phylliscum demangeonii]|nr:MAG: suppressor of loss of ypt1 [Phylliscum demangeonii]
MNAFPRPVTLTLVQFAFVSSWCLFSVFLASLFPAIRTVVPALRHGIRSPSREVLATTLPLAFFQVGGHLLSSMATARIPVSLVHTIKGLSPLFTVIAYRFFFRIHYALGTYLSLIPLTLGVMLACSAAFSGNLFGILCAFGGAIVFVTQNIVSKKLFNEAARAEADGKHHTSPNLDKLNLLCYSSGLAFGLTAPLWLWSEGFLLLGDFFHDGALDLSGKKDALGAGRLALEFIFNGTFHFGQNIMAFVLLSIISPVTYSVASLIKRIFVITVAVVWFGNRTTPVQGAGILLTFFGLYLYDRNSDAAKADRRVKLNQIKEASALLPLAVDRSSRPDHHLHFTQSPLSATSGQLYGGGGGGGANGFLSSHSSAASGIKEGKPAIAFASGRPAASSPSEPWLPADVRREGETWRSLESKGLQPLSAG